MSDRRDVPPAINRLHGTVIGLAVLVVLVAIDLPTDWVLANSYVVAPLLTAVLSRPARTALVGVATIAAAGWSLQFDHLPSSSLHSQVIRMVVTTGVTVIAIVASKVRVSREQALTRMTRIADVAQQALLPSIPPTAGGLRFATRYVSATSEALIGGDLYDMAETNGGVTVLVGDARGKGLDAVQRMVTVLGAFRQSVHRYATLVDVARQLDAVVSQTVGDEDFVTALLVQVDATTVTVVNCGHHPPLLVDGERLSYLDDAKPTLPLGLGSDPEAATYDFGDQRLLLYTDGLVEARPQGGGAFFPLSSSGSLLAQGTSDVALDSLVQQLIRHTGGGFADDVALVLIERAPRIPGPSSGQEQPQSLHR